MKIIICKLHECNFYFQPRKKVINILKKVQKLMMMHIHSNLSEDIFMIQKY